MSDARQQAHNLVLEMIDGCNRIDIDAVVGCFTEDAVYDNIPMQAVQGQAAIRETLANFMAGVEAVQWDVLHLAVNGGVVLTERLDKFKVKGRWVEIPVMGVFETDGGKISAWRDYFDLGQVQSRFAAVGVKT